MEKLKSNIFIKMFLCVIFIFSSAVAGIALVCIILAFNYGCYNENTDTFIKTNICRNYIENRVKSYANEYSYNGYFEMREKGLYVKVYDRGYPYQNMPEATYSFEADDGNFYSITANQSEYYNTVTNEGDFFEGGKVKEVGLEGNIEYIADNGKEYEIFYALEEPIPEGSYIYYQSKIYESVYPYSDEAVGVAIIFSILAAVCLILLVFSAGHVRGKNGITLNFQDKIPLDLYYAFSFVCIFVSMLVVAWLYDMILGYEHYYCMNLVAIVMFFASAVFLSTVLTTSTRIKAGKFWRNTILFKSKELLFKFFFIVKDIICEFLNDVPLAWGVILCTIFVMIVNSGANLTFAFLFDVVVLLAVAKFTKMAVKIEKAAKEMANGNINFKIDTSNMKWRLKEHAENLNSINNGISIAVKKQMKSENLKTELITNVSHDIKTPLTSIINYVELLKTEHTPEQEKEYIEVLSRQSERLKKLISDLIEASKASTGNISVDIKPLIVSEIIYQSLGEYSDKFKKLELNAIVSVPENEAKINADGKLLWRIMDNLFSNVCKYTQYGTRVYVDLKQDNNLTCISVKNISKEQLNINSNELMERFVRGDKSRSTEGSGLGLNIAKSLVELQGGTFRIYIDGDLFKAEIKLKS